MPPKRSTLQTPLDVLARRIDELEARVKDLETNKILTIPSYDTSNLPSNSVEGQIAIVTTT